MEAVCKIANNIEKTHRYEELHHALLNINNIDEKIASRIVSLWKPLLQRKIALHGTHKKPKNLIRSLLGTEKSDEDRVDWQKVELFQLRILLTSVALGKAGSSAYWAYRGLNRSKLARRESVEKRGNTREYSDEVATIMIMSSILGPFESQGTVNDIKDMCQQICQNRQRLGDGILEAHITRNYRQLNQENNNSSGTGHLEKFLLQALRFDQLDAYRASVKKYLKYGWPQDSTTRRGPMSGIGP